LGLWARFLRADGLLPALARGLVATGIVAAVLGFGAHAGVYSTISIYNGLGTGVRVHLADKQIDLPRFSGETVDVDLHGSPLVTTTTNSGQRVEQFAPELSGPDQHYVYNVASASPLVKWTAVYGDVPASAPDLIGARRWQTASADFYFSDPPRTIKSQGHGGSRTVISGAGQAGPDKLLKLLDSPAERQHLIQMHALWDEVGSPFHDDWVSLATATPEPGTAAP
jgi:hypothetical protein